MSYINDAYSILTAKTLEEKLLPLKATHEVSLANDFNISFLKEPGRPIHLAFNDQSKGQKIPKIDVLEKNLKERGRLLHFFANHELLAIELFSMALIRFKDMPEKYHKELVLVISQEQNHLKLYIDRMKDFDTNFGDYPLNNFFWKTLRPIHDPLVFINTINLVFEQANLDFATYYKELFAKIGDIKTSKIFDVIYKDELGHVAHGLKWTEKLRSDGTSQWRSFNDNLPKNIYPRHAKGINFKLKNRFGLNFESAYLEKLANMSDSRSLSKYVFNGGYEHEIQKNTLSKMQKIAREDLAWNFGLVANQNSTLELSNKPSKFFLNQKSTDLIYKNKFCESGEHKIKKIVYWGKPDIADELYDKRLAHKILNEFLKQYSTKYKLLIPKDTVGIETSSIDDIMSMKKTCSKIVIKSPFGTSGQSMLVLDCNRDFSQHINDWIQNHIKKYGSIIVSPWLDKIADFGLQLKIFDNYVKIDGMSRYFTDEKGRLSAYVLNNPYIYLRKETINTLNNSRQGLKAISRELADFVHRKIKHYSFRGPLGIDLILVSHNNQLYLHPMLEINPRFTFGHLALSLEKSIHNNSTAYWMFLASKNKTTDDFDQILKKHPLKIARKQILSGAFFTSDPVCNKRINSFVRVIPN